MTMTDTDTTVTIHSRDECLELARRCADARGILSSRLDNLRQQERDARHGLANAIGELQRSFQRRTADQLLHEHVQQQHQQRVENPAHSKAAQFVRKRSTGNMRNRDGQPLHVLMHRQAAAFGAPWSVGNFRATPPAEPGSNEREG